MVQNHNHRVNLTRQNSVRGKMKFESIYRGYVIKENRPFGMFVGPDSDIYRVLLREHAARFTKNEALDYIKNGWMCKNQGTFVIEDAK